MILNTLLCTLLLLQDAPTKRYEITLRIVSPVVKKLPTPAEMERNMASFSSLSVAYHLKSQTPEKQDQEILTKLRKQFPRFQFPKISKKKSFVLKADTLWIAPKGFVMHDLHLAIIQNDPKFMDDKALPPFSEPEPNSLIPVSYFDKVPKVKFSRDFTLSKIHNLEEEGKVLTFMQANWRCVEENKRFVFGGGFGPREMEKNTTFCLNYNLPISLLGSAGKPNKVAWGDTELVFINIKEVSK